jgi:hypothetical protein
MKTQKEKTEMSAYSAKLDLILDAIMVLNARIDRVEAQGMAFTDRVASMKAEADRDSPIPDKLKAKAN